MFLTTMHHLQLQGLGQAVRRREVAAGAGAAGWGFSLCGRRAIL